MFHWRWIWLVGCWLFLACGPGAADPEDRLRRWAYLIPASFSGGTPELAGYDVLCIGVYRLSASGRLAIRPKFSASAKSALDNAPGVRLRYPLIAFQSVRAGARLLSDAKARARATRELNELLRGGSYDGLHIDFEGLTGKYAKNYAEFLVELKALPGMQSRVLSVAVFPALHRHEAEAAFHDLERIGPAVDQVVLMTYDYHLERPGPVTDLGWAEENVRIARKHVAGSRIWLGVPAYGYEWRDGAATGRPRVITEKRGRELCRRHDCVRHSSGMLRLKRPGRVAFLSDPKLRDDMAAVARRYELRGTALWRVGFEIPKPSR